MVSKYAQGRGVQSCWALKQSRQWLIQTAFCTNACGTEGLGWRAIIVTVFYKEAKDDLIIKQSALPQNKEKTLKKSLKIELESF